MANEHLPKILNRVVNSVLNLNNTGRHNYTNVESQVKDAAQELEGVITDIINKVKSTDLVKDLEGMIAPLVTKIVAEKFDELKNELTNGLKNELKVEKGSKIKSEPLAKE